jgi:L-alanine-DL-glutamate epimerase-like enolase superfamily enzyme
MRVAVTVTQPNEAVNGIWLYDKPLHCKLEGGMTEAEVVQTLPNSTKCGGLTEAWRIAWMAYEHNIQWVPHGWNTALGLAADLHLSAAMPVARYVEFLTPSPYMDELITDPFRPDAEGFLKVPEKPGLGIELNREALKRFGM